MLWVRGRRVGMRVCLGVCAGLTGVWDAMQGMPAEEMEGAAEHRRNPAGRRTHDPDPRHVLVTTQSPPHAITRGHCPGRPPYPLTLPARAVDPQSSGSSASWTPSPVGGLSAPDRRGLGPCAVILAAWTGNSGSLLVPPARVHWGAVPPRLLDPVPKVGGAPLRGAPSEVRAFCCPSSLHSLI